MDILQVSMQFVGLIAHGAPVAREDFTAAGSAAGWEYYKASRVVM